MTYKSRDGEEGFPGNLIVAYTLTRDSLRIDYEAATDKTTVINLTNHTYWNLHSHGNGTILDHVLEINAGNYSPADQTQIPIGETWSIKNTPFDFTKPKAIGVNDPVVKCPSCRGYDNNFVLDHERVLSETLRSCLWQGL